MVALEQASERHGVSTDTLMENAGLAVAQAARGMLGSVAGSRVLVLVGPGNNGADGLVTARHLQRWGADVTAYLATKRPDDDPKMTAARQYGISVVDAAADPDLQKFNQLLGASRLVIDSILGTGRARPLEGVVGEIARRVNSCRNQPRRPQILALDLPTGVNADTGDVDPAALVVDVTVALALPKVGLLTFPGVTSVGRLEVVDIGLPPAMPEEQAIDLELLTAGWVGSQLPVRPLNSHKGTFGHLLVVAGSRSYVGAACLVAGAALRVGAGLVTLATPESVYPIVAAKVTEAIHLPLPEDSDGRVHPQAADVIRNRLPGISALAIGSGMGWSEGTTEFMQKLLLAENPTGPSLDRPLVVDADGLNNLSRCPDWWRHLGGRVVLTPHPGEMATLTGASTQQVQADRVLVAREWAVRWGVTVALKGANTVVAGPEGLAQVSPFANPGLASGGTGDVLTGIVGGLMAQGLGPAVAASCGVYLHGAAAQSVTDQKGNAGIVASDLIAVLPETIKHLKLVAENPA